MGSHAVSDPLERFVQEHEEALAELDRLEAAATALQTGQPFDEHVDTVWAAHGFISGTVREHNENEEKALFPLLGDAAPTGPFSAEHVELRQLENRLLEALEAAEPRAIASAALAIIETLRDHIKRENEMLFPMARDWLGREGMAEVARRLEA